MSRRPHLLSVTSALCAAMLALAPTPTAAQQAVVSGGAPAGDAGYNIFDDNRAASFFSLDHDVSFDAIRFWALLPGTAETYAPYTGNFFWQILADDGSVPDGPGSPSDVIAVEGAVEATSSYRASLNVLGLDFNSQVFDLALGGSRMLEAGNYWLALHDGVLDLDGTHSTMFWETSDDADGRYLTQTFSIDDNWNEWGAGGLAFELDAASAPPPPVTTTPEPASLVLLGTGLLLLAAIARKRRWARVARPPWPLLKMSIE